MHFAALLYGRYILMNEDHCQIECDVSSRSTPSPVTGGGGMYEEQYGRGMDH